MTINYKFREDELIQEFKDYIDQTYGGHYGQGGLQSSEVIVDRGHGLGFFLGNVDKYNGRYGKKGEPEDHRKDILKIIHYGFLALYEHDRIHASSSQEETLTITIPDTMDYERGISDITTSTITSTISMDSIIDWDNNEFTVSVADGDTPIFYDDVMSGSKVQLDFFELDNTVSIVDDGEEDS